MLFTVAENNTGCDSQLAINNHYAIKQLLLNTISLKVISSKIRFEIFLAEKLDVFNV